MMNVFEGAGRSAKKIFVIFACLALWAPVQAQHGQMTPILQEYLNMVYAGDVSSAGPHFTNSPDDPGSRMLAGKFRARFVEGSDGLDLSRIDSPVVERITELFQSYWRPALMQAAPIEILETDLKAKLDKILVSQGFESALEDEDKLLGNVEALVRSEGYFALSGRTPPLLELMIWTSNRVATQSVELTDGTYEIEINSVGDFVSYGWSNFASFGMTSTGGWAREDGIYCLCEYYDLESERYRYSFLKHEARHYVDLGLYPELQASDLEYRGKLTELAFSVEQTYSLLEHFTGTANRANDAPHPLANWYVVEGMSRQVLEGDRPSDPSVWRSIPVERIQAAARRLLEEHDAALSRMGATTAKGIINL